MKLSISERESHIGGGQAADEDAALHPDIEGAGAESDSRCQSGQDKRCGGSKCGRDALDPAEGFDREEPVDVERIVACQCQNGRGGQNGEDRILRLGTGR